MEVFLARLMRGDATALQNFVASKERWDDMLRDIATVEVQTLADRLAHAQGWFDEVSQNRHEAINLMTWTAFSTIVNSDQNRLPINEMIKLVEAFDASLCSIEFKSHAKKVAAYFGVTVSTTH